MAQALSFTHLLVQCSALAVLVLVVTFRNRLIGVPPREDIEGPTGLPLVGNLFHILPWRHRFLRWLIMMQAKYTGPYTFTMPPWGRGIVINHPEWLAHIKRC